MTEGLRSERFAVLGLEDEERRRQVRNALGALPGVEDLQTDAEAVTVRYDDRLISSTLIQREMERLGLAAPAKAKRRGALARFIDRLAASNEQTFGSSRPDCCSLNRRRPGSA